MLQTPNAAMRYAEPQASWAVSPAQRACCNALTKALGLPLGAVEDVLCYARFDLQCLRKLGVHEMCALQLSREAAEVIYYLVQWEDVQSQLTQTSGDVNSTAVNRKLKQMKPIYERHFADNQRLNDALLTLYRQALGDQDSKLGCPAWIRPNSWGRLLLWLGVGRSLVV